MDLNAFQGRDAATFGDSFENRWGMILREVSILVEQA
jgi:hypothetical protein